KNLFELIYKRRKQSSTIFYFQFCQEGWYKRFGSNDNPLADAILDRIVHDAYKINIEYIDQPKEMPMREVFGLDKSQSE
ncbi:ATP-binding protein, partial [Thermodesulfobium sp. 4217-1]|uniref:ATP-binding protein n=1 Tax=Thermodesulfobium sp. 4217-1 TaxID=3120013 RepID=UPI003221C1BA